MIRIDPAAVTGRDMYKLLIGSVVPRPIAWVSTVGDDGTPNLAPYSFFTIASSEPPVLVFFPQRRPDGGRKDTAHNVAATGEFVLHIVGEELAEQMNQSSASYAYGVSEFEQAGLRTMHSELVAPPRIDGAPVSFECRVETIVPIGEADAVFGRVVLAHVRDDVYRDGRILLEALRPIARLAGDDYTRVTEVFSMKRPG